MLIIPLRAVPAQTVDVILGEQFATLTLRQLATGLYMDVQVSGNEVVGLVKCQNLNRIVRNSYLGFIGDLVFVDNSGENGQPSQDPYFTGLDGQFTLIYLELADL